MRAGLVGIFFFVALLALGHYVAAPFFCRGGNVILAFDPGALCGADLHFNRSGSMLLYFGSIAVAFLFGAVAGALPGGGAASPKEKTEAASANPLEQLLAAEEKKEEKKQESARPVAHPSAAQPQPAANDSSGAADAHAAKPADQAVAADKAGPSTEQAAAAAAMLSGAAASPVKTVEKQPEPAAEAAENVDPETAAATQAITMGLVAAKNGLRGSFDGTTEELMARFRELKKQDGVNAIAQAQRLLDESTMAALGKGIDPKQHLSEVANLVLTDDPDLTSAVVRGVVVHIAARLKELGVANKLPGPAKGAA